MAVQCVHRLEDAKGTFLAYLATTSILKASLQITFSQSRIDAIKIADEVETASPDGVGRGHRVTVTFRDGKAPEIFWMKLVPLPQGVSILERPDHL